MVPVYGTKKSRHRKLFSRRQGCTLTICYRDPVNRDRQVNAALRVNPEKPVNRDRQANRDQSGRQGRMASSVLSALKASRDRQANRDHRVHRDRKANPVNADPQDRKGHPEHRGHPDPPRAAPPGSLRQRSRSTAPEDKSPCTHVSLTRVERMRRPLFTATFWLDATERAIKTAAQTVLGLIGTNVTEVTSLNWKEVGIAAAFTTGLSVLTSIVSAGIGEPGSASLLNPAPPDTLEEQPVG